MHLLFRRDQRDDGWFESSITFLLDIRLELTPDERAQAKRYQLLDITVYDSAWREQYRQAAEQRFDAATEGSIFTTDVDRLFSDLAASLWNNLAGLGNALMMSLELHLTYRDLIDGAHVETEDIDAAVNVETIVLAHCRALAQVLDTALTFDGSDTLYEL